MHIPAVLGVPRHANAAVHADFDRTRFEARESAFRNGQKRQHSQRCRDTGTQSSSEKHDTAPRWRRVLRGMARPLGRPDEPRPPLSLILHTIKPPDHWRIVIRDAPLASAK
ncbi:hypothetical protein DB31_5116 [Hyalangium minutum]|uniref:Uncharacterized protein n=1 Tax=Hyalangium minutum TaxID=394096 RepID=A0A085WQW1_9BACT|nr:hypothetical protein DB31_5116 [Hyalangium minutum]